MALPTVFTPGDVLTAANANLLRSNQYNLTTSTKTVSHVLVAADLGTRVLMNAAGSTTITVNTSLFAAGDTLEISNIGAGVCTITSGTCTVTTSSTLALAQYASGTLFFTSASAAIFIASAVTATAGGLTLIAAQVIGTTVSSVTVSSAFSATYDNYKIIISGGLGSTNGTILMTLGATATGYYWGLQGAAFDGTGAAQGNGAANTSSWRAGGFATTTFSMSMDLMSPNLAKVTAFTSSYMQGLASTSGNMGILGGYLNDSTQYTAFTLTPNTGTLTGGTIRVYGYSNS